MQSTNDKSALEGLDTVFLIANCSKFNDYYIECSRA